MTSSAQNSPHAAPASSTQEARAISDDTVDFLLSPTGRDAAQELATSDLSDTQTFSLLGSLRQDFSAAEAGALLALARLRQRAATKFPHAANMFFTGEALEQATNDTVAEHHARWIDEHAPPGPVLDLGCGIGGDTLALAKYRPVIAYETDFTRLHFARANAEVAGLAGRIEFRQEDWTEALESGALPPAAAAFADPARRAAGKRVFHLDEIQPPIAWLVRLQQFVPALGVKVMPGVQDDELPAGCGVEFISHAGVCKEALLWFGPLAHHSRWASVHTQNGWHTLLSSGERPPLGDLAPGMTLHEPDPAVIRAGAFAELCAMLNAHLFDPQIAYLVSPKTCLSSLTQTFQIEEIHPAGLKRLNQRLQALKIGYVELKKRGVPFEPESLRSRLKLVQGGRSAVVIFTRQDDRHNDHNSSRGRSRRIMLIGNRIES